MKIGKFTNQINRLKPTLLTLLTALILAFVRSRLQPGKAGWSTIGDVFIAWLIHWFALILFLGLAGSVIKRFAKFWLPDDFLRSERDWSLNEHIVYGSILILVGLLSLLVIMYWPESTDVFDAE